MRRKESPWHACAYILLCMCGYTTLHGTVSCLETHIVDIVTWLSSTLLQATVRKRAQISKMTRVPYCTKLAYKILVSVHCNLVLLKLN